MFRKDYKYRKQVGIALIAIYVIVPAILIILPADNFDHGPAMCLSVILFHRQCWGCGMTRAIQHIIHLDFDAALTYNKLAFIVFPIIAAVWLINFFKEVNYLFKSKKTEQ